MWDFVSNEYPQVDRRSPFKEMIQAYVLEHGPSTSQSIADGIGRQISNVNRIIRHSPEFAYVRREGRSVFYGLTED